MAEVSEKDLLPGEVDESELMPEGGAEGGTGSDALPSKPLVEPERLPMGSPSDAAKSWADIAALGGGPQIAGAIAAAGRLATLKPGEPLDEPAKAYTDVRDASAKEIGKSEDTWWGRAAAIPGMLSTPLPVKALPKGSGALKHAVRGGKVGAGVGGLHGAINSDADLMSKDDSWQKYAELLKDTTFGTLGGMTVGAGVGGTMGLLEKGARSTARRLPMDMLGIGEPQRRAMQRQGIYDEAGDELLKLVRPGRSGMRKGSLTDDIVAELGRRGEGLDDAVSAVDAAAPGGVTTTDRLADATRNRAKPYSVGTIQDKQIASRMGKEAANMMTNHGELLPEVGAPLSLAEAEAYKQRFGPQVAKLLRHAGEPAAKTEALGETYRALRAANEEAASAVSPELGQKFIKAKKDYQLLAAPLEGANVERSGLRGSDFEWGDALSTPDTPLIEQLAQAGVPKWLSGLVVTPLNLAGRAYGRGLAANAAEFTANRMTNNSGGGIGGQVGDLGLSTAADALAPWSRFLGPDDEEQKP